MAQARFIDLERCGGEKYIEINVMIDIIRLLLLIV